MVFKKHLHWKTITHPPKANLKINLKTMRMVFSTFVMFELQTLVNVTKKREEFIWLRIVIMKQFLIVSLCSSLKLLVIDRLITS